MALAVGPAGNHLRGPDPKVQVDAGAAVVQLFDSWAGALSAAEPTSSSCFDSRAVLESLSGRGVPRIHFGVGTGELLALMRAAGADVVGGRLRGCRCRKRCDVSARAPCSRAILTQHCCLRMAGCRRGSAAHRDRRALRRRAHLQSRPRGTTGDRSRRSHPSGRARPGADGLTCMSWSSAQASRVSAAAWAVCDRSSAAAVTVLEATPQVGGKLRVASVAGQPVDVGAEAVLTRRPEALDLARAAGLGDELVDAVTTSASIFAAGRLHPLPAGTLMGVPFDVAAAASIRPAQCRIAVGYRRRANAARVAAISW